jgi:thiol-disulfide isomerase/thioredoxin
VSRRRLWIGIAVLVAIQGLALAVYALKSRDRPSAAQFAVEVLPPRAAPGLVFARSDGSKAELAGATGKLVLVHFWATWCEPCRDELPTMLALAEELADSGKIELLAVAIEDDWEEIRRFMNGPVPRSIVRPDVTDVHRQFGTRTLPDTYLVDAKGRLVERYQGARDWTSAAARAHVTRSIDVARAALPAH